MKYTEEEIKKYLDILYNYKLDKEKKVFSSLYKCKGCSSTEYFSQYSGYNLCTNCGTLNGHILGQFDLKDFDRLYYRKKSIYHRKYYYEKKIKNISNLLNLTNEEECKVYKRLLEIDDNVMKKINNQYFRKRMININYIIKKILVEMECEKYKIINIKISPKILNIYDKWWESYKQILK